MKYTNNNFGLLSEKQRKDAIVEIINYFSSEKDVEIGIIAAEDILEMFLGTIGKNIYNKGVDDTKSFINERLKDLEIDIETNLKK